MHDGDERVEYLDSAKRDFEGVGLVGLGVLHDRRHVIPDTEGLEWRR